MRAEADAAFARGDYLLARKLYTELAAKSPDDRAYAEERLAALRTDKLALLLGLGTLTFVVIAYFLARFLG